MNRLADLVNIRSENDMQLFTSGCIINMSGFRKDDSDSGVSKDKGIHAIRATAAAFEVSVDCFYANTASMLENVANESFCLHPKWFAERLFLASACLEEGY